MKNLRLFIVMTVIAGIIYPLVITAIAQSIFPEQANGSLVKNVGSKLIAQKFTSDRYFWPRPSAVDYNTLASGGSNLGPISPQLKKAVDERRALYKGANVPAELLFASGSGLDPHISIETAYFQIDRVAKARQKTNEAIIALIDKMAEGPYVNVLMLNLSLDGIQ